MNLAGTKMVERKLAEIERHLKTVEASHENCAQAREPNDARPH